MPPVPKVILAMPAAHAALADEARLLVADEAGDRRRAVERRGRADDAGGVDDRRAARGGDAQRVEQWSSQSAPSPRWSPVTPALVASVTWSAPSDRCQASHESTVPTHRSRRAVGVGHVEEVARPWWPTRWAPRGCPRPAAPGRCRRCGGPASRGPGPTGSPVARSHTIVDARWLVMPTASTGPPSASAARPPRGRSATIARRRTRPARRRACRAAARGAATRRWWHRARTTAARRPLVPTSITRMLMARFYRLSRAPGRRGRAGRACPG